jgi:hypothetical protein
MLLRPARRNQSALSRPDGMGWPGWTRGGNFVLFSAGRDMIPARLSLTLTIQGTGQQTPPPVAFAAGTAEREGRDQGAPNGTALAAVKQACDES